MRRLALPIGFGLLISCAPMGAPAPAPPAATTGESDPGTAPEAAALAEQVEIRRTAYGVPHILAENLEAMGLALAWVQLEDHGQRIVRGLVDARGQSALYYGDDGDLDADFLARRSHDRAVETFPRLPADVRAVYDGFAAGVNRYVELHPEELDGVSPPTFTGADVAARDVVGPNWSVARRFASRAERGVPLLESWSAAGGPAGGPAGGMADVSGGRVAAPGVAAASGVAAAVDGEPESALPGWEPGSNTWAFGPSRTASGHAILMRNPHLSWAAGYYEAHVTVPGVLNFYGDFRLGGPFGMIGGFNERLGWSSTNNAPELDDLYALELDPERPDHYLFDGESLPLERVPVVLEYRRGGVVETETRERWETPVGPVVHRDERRAYVLRTGGEGAWRVGEQFLRMMMASSLDEWQDAMRVQARNASNFTYADADGNIFYVWNAAHPVRPHPHGGDTLAVPARGAADVWSEVIPFDDLPQLLNPPGGYLRNENDPPYHTNLNAVMDRASFPPEFPEPRVRLRSQLSLELVEGDDRLTLEEVWARKHSERMLLADRVKDDLLDAVAAAGATGEVADAARLLAAWDNTVAADARGAVLFAEWWDRYLEGGERAAGTPSSAGFRATPESLFREPWTADAPATTPRGLADPGRAAAAFEAAVSATAERWGDWGVAWGEVHRARVADLDLPVGGCDGLLGCFRVIWFSEDEDGRRRVRGGDGWVSAVEFGDPPRAYTVLAYGQSSREGHPHAGDQLAVFVEHGRKEIAFTEEDIEATLLRRYRPGSAARTAAEDGPPDLVLRNGLILDGRGGPAIQADIAITGDRITATGDLTGQAARRIIDLDGLHVAPGFIDSHSHAGRALATDRLSHARALLAQGVTTVIVNPDGGGAVDLVEQRRALLAHGLGVNVAQLVPHGSVRRAVLGMEDRAPDPDELERMRALVREAMEAGAVGLSSGPFYAPGSYASTDELAALAAVAAEYGGVHQSHIRDEGHFSVGLLAAVDELIEVSRRSGVTGVVTHIKALGPRAWGSSAAVVERIEAARAEGLAIYADQYPYEASATGLTGALAPRWAQVGGADSLRARIERPTDRERLTVDVRSNLEGRGGADRIQFRSYGPDASIEGRTLAAVASDRGQDPIDVALELLAAGGVGIVSFNMDEGDIERFMRQPWTMTASDGELTEPGDGVPHPRGYGTFPRKLARYALERGVVDLETAVRSMTGLPAEVYGLEGRGVVAEGMAADLVVFDPARLNDPASYTDPHHYAEGMVHVLVNGRFAIRDGEFTGERAGAVLRR